MELPILQDGDLTLRPPRADDADAVTAACQDREIQRWTRVPSPYRREHAVEYVGGCAESARTGEAASYLGFDADGRLVASAALMDIDREGGSAEIGYWIAAWARRRGYAVRAARLLREHGHATLGLPTIEIFVHPGNVPSQRVAERAGFTATGERRALPRAPAGSDEPDFIVYVSRRGSVHSDAPGS